MTDLETNPLPTLPKSIIYKNAFPVHKFGKVLWVKTQDITHIVGEGNYSYIHTCEEKRYLVAKSLNEVHHSLGSSFMRIHKSYLVNIAHVLAKRIDGIELRNGAVIPIARRRAKQTHLALVDMAV